VAVFDRNLQARLAENFLQESLAVLHRVSRGRTGAGMKITGVAPTLSYF